MTNQTAPLPRTWRPVRSRVVALTMATVVEVGAIVLAVTLPAGFQGGDRVSIVIFASFLAGTLLVLARPRLAADESGLTVVNLLRSRRLAWSEVVGVDLAETESWASLDLADGTALPVLAVQTADGARFTRAIEELRHLVAVLGAAPEEGGGA